MTDKEKLIDFLESSGYGYKSHKGNGITMYGNKVYDTFVKIENGCGYNMYGEFYFINGKSITYGFFE